MFTIPPRVLQSSFWHICKCSQIILKSLRDRISLPVSCRVCLISHIKGNYGIFSSEGMKSRNKFWGFCSRMVWYFWIFIDFGWSASICWATVDGEGLEGVVKKTNLGKGVGIWNKHMILPIEHLEISTFQRLASVLWLKQRTEEKVVFCKKRGWILGEGINLGLKSHFLIVNNIS